MFFVPATPFNEANAPESVGLLLEAPPSYTQVQKVEKLDDIDREFYLEGVGD